RQSLHLATAPSSRFWAEYAWYDMRTQPRTSNSGFGEQAEFHCGPGDDRAALSSAEVAPPHSGIGGRHRLSLWGLRAIFGGATGSQRTAALDLAAVLGAGLGQSAAVAQRELDGAFGDDPCLQLPHPLHLGIHLCTEQQRHVGDPQPKQEDDHTRQ